MQRFVLSIVAVLALVAPPPAPSQSSDRLSGREAAETMDRISDLLEATRIVIPELSRAGAPLQENFRQGVNTLRTTPSPRSHWRAVSDADECQGLPAAVGHAAEVG